MARNRIEHTIPSYAARTTREGYGPNVAEISQPAHPGLGHHQKAHEEWKLQGQSAPVDEVGRGAQHGQTEDVHLKTSRLRWFRS